MLDVTKRTFLLIKDGVVASATTPADLFRAYLPDFDVLDGFKVAIGCTNEFGEREIVGIVADVAPLVGCVTWYITSYQDGYYRHIGATGAPDILVSNRLHSLYEAGDYDDLVNLPQAVRIVRGRAHVVESLPA